MYETDYHGSWTVRKLKSHDTATDGYFLCLLLLSDIYNNNLSLSVPKTNTFSGHTLTGTVAPKDYIATRFVVAG